MTVNKIRLGRELTPSLLSMRNPITKRELLVELSVVVPVYNEEQSIPVFLDRMMPILNGITRDFEIIFSMDPSRDRTEEVILEHRRSDPRLKLLKFSRRVGQPMATLAGMQYSNGRAVVVIDENDNVVHAELVGEIKNEPNYDAALAALK